MTPEETIPTSLHPIAELYQRSVLDPMVEVAHAVSHDFVRRPQHYRDVPQDIAGILEGFRIRTGGSPEWLSATQRAQLYSPLFGAAFCASSIGLRSASVAFAERSEGRNADLLDGVRDAAFALRSYIKGIEGRVVSVANSETGSVFRSAIEVLRNEAVARVFGLAPVPSANWPFDGAADAASSDAAYLIEEIQRALTSIQPAMILKQQRFILLQRAAHYGAMTITGVLDEVAGWESADRGHALVRHAYSWEKALQGLLSKIDVVRAWKDPQYRRILSPCEKEMMAPHPAGEVDLKDTQLNPAVAQARIAEQGFSTMTYFAICCCTGDLPCPEPGGPDTIVFNYCTLTCPGHCQ